MRARSFFFVILWYGFGNLLQAQSTGAQPTHNFSVLVAPDGTLTSG
jgi:hypothetical protein